MTKEEFEAFFESQCIPAGLPFDEIAKRWGTINNNLDTTLPSKLYRFRKVKRDEKGKDYMIDSLKSKTIATCSASCFSDKYDALCYFDENRVWDLIIKLINKDTIQDFQSMVANGAYPDSLPDILKALMLRDNQKIRETSAEDAVWKLRRAIANSPIKDRIITTLRNSMDFLRDDNTTQIACFTENVRSKFMWDMYADGYKGYALEYDFSGIPLMFSLLALPNETTHSALLPVFYSDERYDLSNYRIESFIIERYMATEIESLKPILSNIDLLDLCRPYLYKSTEYSREKEWRLICKWGNRNNKYANIVDFDKLKAIYYGPEMLLSDREELHKIAANRELKEYNVRINYNSKSYDLDIEEV